MILQVRAVYNWGPVIDRHITGRATLQKVWLRLSHAVSSGIKALI